MNCHPVYRCLFTQTRPESKEVAKAIIQALFARLTQLETKCAPTVAERRERIHLRTVRAIIEGGR